MDSNYPKTKEEWWEIVDRNWKDLKQIVLNFYPCQKDFPEKGHSLEEKGILPNPQAACNRVIKDLREEKPIWPKKSFSTHIEELKETEDTKLAEIFNTAWFGIPESESSRRLPGFYVFCDLCSESYVLYEKEEGEQ